MVARPAWYSQLPKSTVPDRHELSARNVAQRCLEVEYFHRGRGVAELGPALDVAIDWWIGHSERPAKEIVDEAFQAAYKLVAGKRIFAEELKTCILEGLGAWRAAKLDALEYPEMGHGLPF